jgi:mono/diheme cytochrome c family protein
MSRNACLPALLVAVLAGCSDVRRTPPIEVWSDMKHQGKYMPQGASRFFADQRASRTPVEGTVSREDLQDDAETVPITADTLKLGRAKFDVYCAPCHSRVGDGKGMVALRTPTWQPSNLHDARIKAQSDRELFQTVSFGKSSMPPYRFQISGSDRWAIVAYVRALQRTDGTVDDVPPTMRAELR